MAEYLRIAGTDIYLRVFEQGDFEFYATARARAAVELDLARDFADARAICGSESLPDSKHYFTFEGQQTAISTQAVWRLSGYPIAWGMLGEENGDTVHLAVLRGGYNPDREAMNYYLPLITCDGEVFESTNQTTAYVSVNGLTVYENNPNFAAAPGVVPKAMLMGLELGKIMRRRIV